MKLLELLGNCIRCGAGPLLNDENVWEMAQCCFRISRLSRASHLMQKTAEATLSHLILTVFSRIKEFSAPLSVVTAQDAAAPSAAASSAAPPLSGVGLGAGTATSAAALAPSIRPARPVKLSPVVDVVVRDCVFPALLALIT